MRTLRSPDPIVDPAEAAALQALARVHEQIGDAHTTVDALSRNPRIPYRFRRLARDVAGDLTAARIRITEDVR